MPHKTSDQSKGWGSDVPAGFSDDDIDDDRDAHAQRVQRDARDFATEEK
jgi:hypothetical protein